MYPRLFEFGPITLYSFGLMVILGFLAGVWLAGRLARERGLPGEAFMDGAVAILLASLAGARLLFVALNWEAYAGRLFEVAAIYRGGMSFHGGAIAGIAAGLLWMRRRKLPPLAMADAAAPALALGTALGRVGCLLNGCCYGGPTTLPWGLHFPGTDPALRYHPAQLYDGLLNLLLAAALVVAYRRPHRVGQVLALYVVGASVTRAVTEAFRKGFTAEVFAGGLTEAQVFCLATLALGAAAWLWLGARGRPAPERRVPATPVPSPLA